MLRLGQVPIGGFGETPDVFALVFARQSPQGGDGSASGDAGSGSGTGGDAGAAGGSGGDGGTGSDGTAFDAARAQRTISSLRDEIKTLKGSVKDRDDLASRLQAIEDKDKTDSEKAVSQLRTTEAKLKAAELEAESLKTKYRHALITSAIEREAQKANAIDAEVVAALVDVSGIDIDDDGHVTGADKAVTALLKAKTFLVKTDGSDSKVKGVGGTPDGAGSPTREELIKQHAEQQQKTGLFSRM